MRIPVKVDSIKSKIVFLNVGFEQKVRLFLKIERLRAIYVIFARAGI